MIRHRGVFICFSGIDGSGKTLVARGMATALQQNGVRARYVYGGLNSIFSRPATYLARSLAMGGKRLHMDYHAYRQTKRRIFDNAFLAALYRWVLLSDHYVQLQAKLFPSLTSGVSVVSDRYIHDTLLTHVAVDAAFTMERIEGVLRRWSVLLPKPDVSFLLDVPEEVAFARKDDVPSLDYLRERRGVYLLLAKQQGMRVLDGTVSSQQVLQSALEHVYSVCPALR